MTQKFLSQLALPLSKTNGSVYIPNFVSLSSITFDFKLRYTSNLGQIHSNLALTVYRGYEAQVYDSILKLNKHWIWCIGMRRETTRQQSLKGKWNKVIQIGLRHRAKHDVWIRKRQIDNAKCECKNGQTSPRERLNRKISYLININCIEFEIIEIE